VIKRNWRGSQGGLKLAPKVVTFPRRILPISGERGFPKASRRYGKYVETPGGIHEGIGE
jgi:hypothetical protein